MVVPTNLSGASPLDPLVLLPIPSALPTYPSEDLKSLLQAFDQPPFSSPSPYPPTSPTSSSSTIPHSVLTSQMRYINRNAHILLNASRQNTALRRDELDQSDLELRTVEYELQKVREEARRCEGYEAGYRGLELVSPEEFFENAGEGVVGALPPKEDEGYDHAVTLARLEYELSQIKERESELSELIKQRDSIIRSNKDIKMKFQTSDTYLTDFARTAGHMLSKIESVASKPAS